MLADNGALSVAMAASGGRQKPNRKHRAIYLFIFLNVWSSEDCWQANNLLCEMLRRSRSKNWHRITKNVTRFKLPLLTCAGFKSRKSQNKGIFIYSGESFVTARQKTCSWHGSSFKLLVPSFLPNPYFRFCNRTNYFMTQIWPNVLQEADSVD